MNNFIISGGGSDVSYKSFRIKESYYRILGGIISFHRLIGEMPWPEGIHTIERCFIAVLGRTIKEWRKESVR